MSLDSYLDKWKAVPVRTRGLALIGVITLLLVGMAAREQIRRSTGQEVILAAAPVDPRDLLRGAYVELDYPSITRVDVPSLAAPPDFTALQGKDHLYLALEHDEVLGWRVTRVLAALPAQKQPGEVILKAKYKSWSRPPKAGEPAPTELMLDIGADRYFADEETAKSLGSALRDKNIEVVLAIGGDGAPAIKGLVLDGVRQDEGFF